ncbi:MAG: diaminopimelate decarboxylase [Cyclobacteriaceae bacterium]|nr:diaminopimelate decarboxylase [Cyclobacteriaceae bacterium HetDA_MAG_MS6]
MELTALESQFQELETPFYYYDIDLLRKTLVEVNKNIAGRPFQVHYAVKANVNTRLLVEIKNQGFGADCVSGNEVKRALEVGFPKEHIVFAGVGKTDKELQYGLENEIFAFNVESLQELQVLDELSGSMGKQSRYALRLNPNVDAGTHEYITTGKRDNKFGITFDEVREALPIIRELKNTSFIGIHFHIGSQISDISKFRDLCLKINDIHDFLAAEGFELPHINVGGGLGINYEDPINEPIPDFRTYFDLFERELKLRSGQTLHFELGRSLVGQCGSLISRVLYNKPGEGTNFLILDAGMTELLRPALYKAYHYVQNLSRVDNPSTYDVVGPICETSDAFARRIQLPESSRGDIIALRSTGAYAEVMSSRYNLREIAPSVFSDDLK